MPEQAAEKAAPFEDHHDSRAALDYRHGYLCVMTESEIGERVPNGPVAVSREWYPLKRMSESEARALVGRALKRVDSSEGLYVDEEGEAFQLAHKSRTQPIDSKLCLSRARQKAPRCMRSVIPRRRNPKASSP